VYDWVIRAYEYLYNRRTAPEVDARRTDTNDTATFECGSNDGRTEPELQMQTLPPLLLIYGPAHPHHLTLHFEKRLLKLRTLGACTCSSTFIDPRTFIILMKSCLGAVTMCGCNTMTEILTHNVRAIVVPRHTWRQEQLIRARAFESRKACVVLLPSKENYDVSWDSELCLDRNPVGEMLTAIEQLKLQPRPAEVIDCKHLLDGLNRIRDVLRPRDSKFRSILERVYDVDMPLAQRLEVFRGLRDMGNAGLRVMKGVVEAPPIDLDGKNLRLLRQEILYMIARAEELERIFPKTQETVKRCLRDEIGQECGPLDDKMWPDFMVIGASKCGTSSIVRYLLHVGCISFHARSGCVCTPAEDVSTDMGRWDALESHVFDVRSFSKATMLGRLADFSPDFPLGLCGQGLDANFISGHYTPHYIFHPLVPFRIARLAPPTARKRMRFIVILRNPVDRALSSFWFKKSTGAEIPEATIEKKLRRGMVQRRRMEAAVREVLGVAPGSRLCCFGECGDEEGLFPARLEPTAWEKALDGLYFGAQPADARRCESNLFVEHIGKGIYYDQLLRWFAMFPRDNFFITSLEEFKQDNSRVFMSLLDFVTAGKIDGHTGGPSSLRLFGEMHLKDLLSQRFNATPIGEKSIISQSLLDELEEFYAPYNTKLFEVIGRKLW
jgi:hypothetical protein